MSILCLVKIHGVDRLQVQTSSGTQTTNVWRKSIILVGDAVQLPPVGDKPLYHSKPPNHIGQQGFIAYSMFNNVVELTKNQRVDGIESDQESFRRL